MGVHDPRSMQTIENVFDLFCSANTMQGILSSFNNLCSLLGINSAERCHLFTAMQTKLSHYWKAKALFSKLNKRAEHKEYGRGLLCHGMNAVVIGAGPCGLRTSIELALLGANVVVLEKRDKFSRNNVLHLWPYLIDDLRSLGAKKFFGKFCFGSIDHISIRTLQCILLKVALIFGVRVIPEIEFESIIEPKSPSDGWHLKFKGKDIQFLRDLDVRVLVGADGKRNTLPGFRHKQFRAKLAIAITVNFLNKHTQEEALVKEISGLSFIFNQKFFMDLKERAGIDLENIVYYKDETHYFVMTAKKACLMDKGVLKEDFDDPVKLLDKENINKDALLNFAQEAAVESTYGTLPHADFALNQYGQPDVAVFDFTSLFAAEHASRLMERHHKQLLMCLVGDSLLEPFWPTGSGCARGFLGAFDAAWMVRRFGMGKMNALEFLSERESIFQRLTQTEPDKMNKNYSTYTIDPRSRYMSLDAFCVRPRQITHLYDTDHPEIIDGFLKDIACRSPAKISQSKESNQRSTDKDELNFERCLRWFQVKLHSYSDFIEVKDLTESWFNGVGFLCLIHLYRTDLVDLNSIIPTDAYENTAKAFEIFERDFGIAPLLSVDEFLKAHDQLTMCSYLELVYEALRGLRPAKENRQIGRTVPKRWRGSLSLQNRINAQNKIRRDQQEIDSENVKRHQTNDHNAIESGIANKRSALLKEALTNDLVDPAQAKDIATRRSLNALSVTNKGKVNNLAQKLFPTPGSVQDNIRNQSPPIQTKRSKVVIPDALLTMVGENIPKPTTELRPPLNLPGIGKGAVARAAGAMSGRMQSSSDRCYFCGQQVYLVERMTAEGYFFHRGCLKCNHCGTRLRLSTYVFHREPDGRGIFYCFAHYAVRHAGEMSRDLRDYYDDTLYDMGGLQTEGSLTSSRNNNFRTPERAEFQYYAGELREVDEASICDYNRLSTDYLEDQEEEYDEDEEEDDEVLEEPDDQGVDSQQMQVERNRKFSWENAVEAARRIATKNQSRNARRQTFGTGSSTDLDSTSAGAIDLTDSDLDDVQMPEDMPARLPQDPMSSAPIIHRDSSAKMKFYMEAPKPVQINARDFFAKCNLTKLKTTELEDITESTGLVDEPVLASVTHSIAVAPSVGLSEEYSIEESLPVGENATRVTCSDYYAEKWELCCGEEYEPLHLSVVPNGMLATTTSSPTATTSVTLEDGEQLQSESRTEEQSLPSSPQITRTEPQPILSAPSVPFTFDNLSDIRDIDSSSVPTENSCASDQDIVNASLLHTVPQPERSQSPQLTVNLVASSDRVISDELITMSAHPNCFIPKTLSLDHIPGRRSREVSTHSLHSSSSSIDSAPLLDNIAESTPLHRRKITPPSLSPEVPEAKAESLEFKEGAPFEVELTRKKISVSLSDSSVENLAAQVTNVSLDIEEKREAIYENVPLADMTATSVTAASTPMSHVSNPMYDTLDFPLMDSTVDSSAHLSSTDENRSKSSLPITDSSLRSKDASPLVARRRKRRKMRKVKGLGSAKGPMRGSVDSSLADTSATEGDERHEFRRQKRTSMPFIGKWKGWFSSSSSTGRRSKQRSLEPEVAPEDNALNQQLPGDGTDNAVANEEERLVDKRKRQLARERDLYQIQCQLEDVESRLRLLEDRGVLAEQDIRGSRTHEDGSVDDNAMADWMHLIHEKNELLKVESELTISSRELELTYRQECLEEEYRRRMEISEGDKTAVEKHEEDELLKEMIKVVEERNKLVSYLDEMRLEEQKKESEANTPMSERGGDELSVRDMILLGATKESKLI